MNGKYFIGVNIYEYFIINFFGLGLCWIYFKANNLEEKYCFIKLLFVIFKMDIVLLRK